MAALNDSFGALAENFFASMFKFSPIKGFLLGKRIGKFYKNLLEGFEKSKKDVEEISHRAIEGLKSFERENQFLNELVEMLIHREK